MPITFNNININKTLLALDEELRTVASGERFADKLTEIQVVIAEERFGYYVADKPIGRGVYLAIRDPDASQVCMTLAWTGGAFVCNPMTITEIKAQFVVLLKFLVDGVLPEMVGATKDIFTTADVTLGLAPNPIV